MVSILPAASNTIIYYTPGNIWIDTFYDIIFQQGKVIIVWDFCSFYLTFEKSFFFAGSFMY